ncbi:hypothetical protein FOZ61_000683 [Perkinsus olseni]|uniref:protein-serine/threonine phosphatase n=1 Tax=Perkinsus olseni TaxID=32597 RepID=A0A7J6LZ98_PEROL|nr:hypothetical protein FOZ61_000683 [Perkinsus olseni]
MGASLSCVEEAVRDVDTECADWGPLAVSVSSVQGWRRSMEDAHVAHWDAKKKIGIFGVFDGHGGQAVALYVAKHLVPILTDREAYRQGKYERALHETFMELDRLMITEKGKKEVAILDEEAQAACPDPILRLPVNTVKRDLLALIGEDSSDEDMEDSDDSDDDSEGEVEEAGDGDMKDVEPPSAGQAECRRSTRIAASKKQGRKKDKKQVAIDGLLFLLQFLIPNLPKDISKALRPESRVECTDDGFLELRQSTLNDIIGRDSTPEGQGCTAVVCLIALGDDEEYPRLICANAGDSRCMVVRDGKAYDLSEDHKPSLPVERERITQAGGVIEQCEGGDRVQGDLNLSRSLGDHRYKKDKKLYPECQIISGMPDIRVRALTSKDTHIILGCDGVWEVHTNAGAAEKVVEFEQRLEKGSSAGSEVPLPKSNTVHTIDGSVEDRVTESLSKITAAMCSTSVRDSLVPTEPSGECEGTDNVTFMLVKIAPAVREELKPLPVEFEKKEENPSPATPIVFGRGPGTKTACEAAMKVMRGKRKRRDGKHKKKNRRALGELLLAEVMAQINTLPKVPGRIGKLISRMGIRRHKYLDHFDQAPEMSVLRREKDKHARDTMLTKQQIGSLFGEEERNALLESKRDVRKLAAEKEQVLRSTVNEGLRVYRALRPDALPFYQEDAVLSIKAKMNRLHMMESGRGVAPNQTGAVLPRDKLQLKNEVVDPFQFQLPVVNPKAFLIALEAACRSLCDDLEYIASCLGIKAEELPAQDDPLRFQRLVESVMFAFPLRKDPEYVDEFMFNHWPRLKQLMPPAIAELPDTDVADWLRGHLQRVIHNQKEHRKIWLHKAPKKGTEEWYSFGEDFIYDTYPLPATLVDDRNLEFPVQDAGKWFESFAKFFEFDPEENGLLGQFKTLVHDLEKIGLGNWLKMNIEDIEKHIPKGNVPLIRQTTPADMNVASMMLKAAARGKPNLLDFEATDPYKLLHGLPSKSIPEELAALPENPYLSDEQIDRLMDIGDASRVLAVQRERNDEEFKEFVNSFSKTPVEQIIESEVQSYKTMGPAVRPDENSVDWKWKQPLNAVYDARRQMYLRQQNVTDPLLNYEGLRQHLMAVSRLCSMAPNGRVYYYRCILMVGNGKGVYGFGVGYGNTITTARADAAMQALKRLQARLWHRASLDDGFASSFTREYGQKCKILPLPAESGILCNRRYLPWVYIMGLHNVELKFEGELSWLSRTRAITRTTSMIMSRRTVANGEGKKYAHLMAPGDHWVHWPDRWFKEVRRRYDQKGHMIRHERRLVERTSSVEDLPIVVGIYCMARSAAMYWYHHWRSGQGSLGLLGSL